MLRAVPPGISRESSSRQTLPTKIVLRSAVKNKTALFIVEAKFGCDSDFVADRRERLSDKLFVCVGTVKFGCIEEGDAFFMGCTNHPNALILVGGGSVVAAGIHAAESVQTEYSLMNRDVEQNGVLKTCGELEIGFVPWGPVGQGYLTVKIDAQTKFDPKMDVRSEFPRFSSENITANMPIVDFLRQFSEKKDATPVQISLAWLLAQEPFIVPIPGTRSADHLHENLRAVDVQLTPADLREIETDLSKIEVHGGRMNEERMNAVDQTE